METKELQRLAVEIVDRLDKKFDIKRDAQLNISQMMEEMGELAKVANLEKLRGKQPEKKDLEDEFADVLIQLAKLADLFGIDLEKAVLDKIEILRKRHSL